MRFFFTKNATQLFWRKKKMSRRPNMFTIYGGRNFIFHWFLDRKSAE